MMIERVSFVESRLMEQESQEGWGPPVSDMAEAGDTHDIDQYLCTAACP